MSKAFRCLRLYWAQPGLFKELTSKEFCRFQLFWAQPGLFKKLTSKVFRCFQLFWAQPRHFKNCPSKADDQPWMSFSVNLLCVPKLVQADKN